MKIAIVGLASERPHEYGEVLMARDIEIACVWDYEHSKADAYARRFRGAVITDFDQVPDIGVDGAVLTVKKGNHARYAIPLLAGGVPVLIGNPEDMTPEDTERTTDTAREHNACLMTAQEPDPAKMMEQFLVLCDVGEMPDSGSPNADVQ